jgi:ubiquinone/menaquinone biosynthesis C-methylase UbiE
METILYDEHIIRYRFVADFVKNKRVLDIASGSGYGSALLAEAGAAQVIGIDLDEQAIKEAKARYNNSVLHFQTGSAEKLDLADKSVECVSSFETIEHLTDVGKYLKELQRVLTDDGVAFISTPNRIVSQEKNPFHTKEFSKEEFKTALQEYFPVVRIFEQKNGLSSVISAAEHEQGRIEINDNHSEAIYFIAVCSKKEITEKFRTVSSVNVRALQRWENNKGWKLLNFLYKLFHG